MTDINYLEKFPIPTLKFIKDLTKNNNRDWFKSNRKYYEENFLFPAQALVEEIGHSLHDINPDFKAIPRIDKSIFRIHRDVRFSKNKDPYKTNLGVYFWEGTGKKMETSGLYFHIDQNYYFVGLGMYQFTKEQLKKYREVVSNENLASQLNEILIQLEKKGYLIGGKTYKSVPRGMDKEYIYAELTKHSGMYLYTKNNDSMALKNKNVVEVIMNVFNDLRPIHDWLFIELGLS